MDNKRLELLNAYIKSNVAPILIEKMPKEVFHENAVIIESTIDKTHLNGHYEGIKYLPPNWFKELEKKDILVIHQLSSISKNEQKKFVEILKYRKVSTFDLPKRCVIIITCDDSSKISEEIYSLVAHIGE